MKHKKEEKEIVYQKKKPSRQSMKDSNTTLDLVSDDFPMTQNFGYCLTTANEHSIINDIVTDNVIGSNFINDSIEFDTPNAAQREQLSQKIIEIIKNTIQSKISSDIIFPHYHFRRGYRIVYYDQLRKLNDFQREFYPLYSIHVLSRMLAKDQLRFKIINKYKIAWLMKQFESQKPRLLNKQKTLATRTGMNPKGPPNKSKTIKQPKGEINPTITLELMTKIPTRNTEKIKNNKLLELTYGKAKEATVGIRRIEYAYNMMTTLKYNTEEIKRWIRKIQRWWRSIGKCYKEFFITARIQSRCRGNLSRIAMYDTCRLIDDVLPFLFRVDNIIVRNKIEQFFNKLYRRYAYLSISRKLADQIDMIKRNIKSYIMKKRQLKTFGKPNMNRCSMIKFVYEEATKQKIDKLQSSFRFFLMHNNEKTMYNFAHDVHPYLYYKLKYKRKTPVVYQKKIVKFNGYVKKLKLLNLKANKGIMNEFEYLRVILLRRPFNDLKHYNKEYVQRRKNELLGKFVGDLDKETKLQKKYFDRWRQRMRDLIKKEQASRMEKLIRDVLIPHSYVNLRRYFELWKKKITLIYKIASLFHKKKRSDLNLFLNTKKAKCLKDLFDDYNAMRPGQKERELENAMKRWKDKVKGLKARDEKLNRVVLKRDDNNNSFWKRVNLNKLALKCNAKRREDQVQDLLAKKSLKENKELSKYFQRWKKDCLQKLLTSIVNKSISATTSSLKDRFDKWKRKAAQMKEREESLKNALTSSNNRKLLQMALDKYRKKTQQVKSIEFALRDLITKTTEKNEAICLRKYFNRWKFKTLMNDILTKLHNKKMTSLLDKWRRHKQSLHSIDTLLKKKNRVELVNLRKYFDRWRNYNVIYKKLILPLYQSKIKLFEMILKRPFDKRNNVNKAGAIERMMDKAQENKDQIVSNLKKAILKKHSTDLSDKFNKWKSIKDDIVSEEKLNNDRVASVKNIFTDLTLRFSAGNLQKYFTQWRMNAGYHLRNFLTQKKKQEDTQLRLYFLRWRKQAYKAKLNSASDVITHRVKMRNYLRAFNKGCDKVFIQSLLSAAKLFKNRSRIKKTSLKNLFSFVRTKMAFSNGVKGLMKIAPIANRQLRLFFLKWKIQAKRIIITQRRFYKNVQRRILTNEKRALMISLVKKANRRAQQMKGGFFKNYKKAAGVYYVKCSHINLQVFFLYRQKKYLSKRKYRMLKYVINKVNTKLIKHQSLKRFAKDWLRIVRYCSMQSCLMKRITYLEKGRVALRFGIRKWFYTS